MCYNCFGFLLKLKGERKFENKIVEYNLQLHAHIGSAFDTLIVSNSHPCDKRIDIFHKKWKKITKLKVFNGYIQNNEKQIPQYLHFRRGVTQLNYSLKNSGRTFELQ